MPVFDLEENSGAIWFDFPGGGRIQLRAPTPADMMRIRKETVTVKPFLHQEKDQPPRVLNQEIMDADRQAALYVDCAIVAWEDFFDKAERPIPCHIDTKTALMRMNSPVFRDFVNEKLKALDAAQVAQADDEIKN